MPSFLTTRRSLKVLALTLISGLVLVGGFMLARSSARQEIRKQLRSNASSFQAKGFVRFLKHPSRYLGDCDGLVLDRLDFGGMQLESVEIRGCDFSETKFDAAEILDCRFEDCLFNRCDLSDAIIKRSVFERCSFSDANFTGAVLQEIDFSSSTFAEAQIEVEQLQGLKGLDSAVLDESLREALQGE